MNESDNPLVSVVVVACNSRGYVIETLESVKRQSWHRIELIVTDDCSTDDTVSLCSDWIAANRDRFEDAHVITSARNTGVAANCNRGFRAATGQWIKPIAGDDLLLDDCIAHNLAFAGRNPTAGFILSDLMEIDEEGVPLTDSSLNEGLYYLSHLSPASKQLKAYCRWPAFVNTPSLFLHRSVLQKVNFCDETFRIYEDAPLIIKLLERDISLNYLHVPTVVYRVHMKSLSRTPELEQNREKEALSIYRKYRRRHLRAWHPLDLSVMFESWLRFTYKGSYGCRGDSLLRKLSLHYWYMRKQGVYSY